MNDLPSSDELYFEAVDAALNVDPPVETANRLLQIVASLVAIRNDDYAKALLPKTLMRIRQLDDAKEKAYLLRLFIRQLCEMELLNDAVETLQHLDREESEQRELALRIIAVAQARAGFLEEARKTAEEIEYQHDYEIVLEQIGKKQIQLKLFRNTLEPAREFHAEPDRQIPENTEWHPGIPSPPGAVGETALEIEEGETRARLLCELALAQWNDEDPEGALATLRGVLILVHRIENQEEKDRSLSAAVLAFANIHRMIDALSTAREIADPFERIRSICPVIESMQRDGNFVGAKSAAEEMLPEARRIDEPRPKSQALLVIGCSLHRIGDSVEARAVFRETLAAIREIKNLFSQAQAMTDFAIRLAELGLPENARKVFRLAVDVVWAMEGISFQILSIGRIIRAQAEARLIDEALKTIEVFEELCQDLSFQEIQELGIDRDKVVLLGLVAGVIKQSGIDESLLDQSNRLFWQGIQEARQIANPLNRSLALTSLAESIS